MNVTAPEQAVLRAAEVLVEAAETQVPCPPVRDLIGADDLVAAYAVQERVTAARIANGATVVGRKIGLTSAAVQQQIGVDTPDFGVLFDDMQFHDGDTIPADAVLQPRAEAEIAFVLAKDLVEGDLGYDDVRSAIAYAVAAIEVCGSRIANWDISFGDTVADNASAGVYVLGTERRTLDQFEPRDVTMSMTVDGVEVSTGTGAACLDDPVNAVVWLARQAREFGEPLRAGQVILSGALGPMQPITSGNTVRSTVSSLGSVSFTVGGGQS
ncbi:2-keto-4-pentenoate hydratase [[Mycobacterium] wendilense]|uniref:Fumarylacetoacetate hydrolase family protein n=1 Tax=[Mycobacterium] wendilense TaxID=3064284 RepID=A0ABN9P0U7_9MYCO|nr:fumarylacetoacetate hydrolase family protein [Mycolicibacterium sp. MU0050]CAJ1584542.1 fumarylacetoacetate hydrolase family protein [Mycolicibacterium sp. MU0050]